MASEPAAAPILPEGEFWLSSGHRLLLRRGDGRLAVTDEFLRAYLSRPELRPTAESCPAEIGLHQQLMTEPRCTVDSHQVTMLADPDLQQNYRFFLSFRDLLLSEETLEASYLLLFRKARAGIPPLFVEQLTHVVLRNILDGCQDPFRLRAAELLFRAQTVSIADGAVLLADDEIVALRAARSGGKTTEVPMDLLTEPNAADYWRRSDRFDLALDVGFGRAGLDALCRVLEAWIEHFLAVEVSVQPVQRIRDERWAWHVGLDAEATAMLNALYRGEAVPETAIGRILSLFRLEFRHPEMMRPDVAGRPVYLAMAMDAQNRLRLKPQNLLVGLPIRNAD